VDNSLFYSAVGQRIVAARKAKGLTQEVLALKLHMSRPALANIERGAQRLPLHLAAHLTRVLDLPNLDALLPPVSGADALDGTKLKIFGPPEGVSQNEATEIERIYFAADADGN
jgi:transcriptional regulator with XRE-family HTH domain